VAKISWEEFLIRAREVWGDKYEYKYENPETFSWREGWVTLICNDNNHSPGEETRLHPCNHVVKNKHRNPAGCRACFLIEDSKQKQKPFSEFLRDARKVHGYKYDYIEPTYNGAKADMSIVCRKHKKIFRQSPDGHINGGHGCIYCGHEKMSITSRPQRLKKTIERLHDKSKGSVALIESSFVSQHHEADFICNEHGEFRDLVSYVVHREYPCLDCNPKEVPNLLSSELIRKRLAEREGKYKILEIDGEGYKADIKVECLDCARDIFQVKFGSIATKSYVCGECHRKKSEEYRKAKVREYIKNSKDTRFKSWLERSIQFHNDKYDYSLVKFASQHEDVEIICPVHGVFWQKAERHLKNECGLCADEKLGGKYSDKYFERFPKKKTDSGVIYYIKIEYEDNVFYKVGISKNSVKTRFTAASGSKEFKLTTISSRETNLYNAYQIEQKILSKLEMPEMLVKDKKMREIFRKHRIGRTETFEKPLSESEVKLYFESSEQI